MEDIRCGGCHRLLAKAADFRRLQIKCPRCGTVNDMRTGSSEPERQEAPAKKGTHENNIDAG